MQSTAVKKHEKIDTVIFDLGGVLLNWNPRGYLEERVENPEIAELFMREIFLSPRWNDLDRGTLSLEEGREFFRQKTAPHGELFRRLWEDLSSLLYCLEENVPVLEKLSRRGYRLLVLSNFIKEYYLEMRKRYSFFSLFDGGVISWEIKALKPEPAIYDALIARYSLVPERCLFIDDRPENVEGARIRGLQGLHYPGEKPLGKYLECLLQE